MKPRQITYGEALAKATSRRMDDEEDDSLIGEAGQADRLRHEMLLKQLEAKKRARNIPVPTNDNEVKRRLRELRKPITVFGERVSGNCWISSAHESIAGTSTSRAFERRISESRC